MVDSLASISPETRQVIVASLVLNGVLLFVNQTTTSTRLDAPKVDLNRVRHSHPDPALIGQQVAEPIVVADGQVAVVTDGQLSGLVNKGIVVGDHARVEMTFENGD